MVTRVQRSLRLDAKSKNELDRLTGARGEIFYDNTAKTLRIYDGGTTGGLELLKADLSNIAGGGGGSGDVDFGDKTIVAAGFEGPVTGTVSSISNHTLNDLGDVNTAGVQSGQVLFYTGTEWQATTLASTFNGGNVGGITNFLNALESTSTSTGGVVVSGGLGVGKNINAGGTLSVTGNVTVNTDKFQITASSGNTTLAGTLSIGSTATIRSRSELRFNDTDNTNYVAFRAPNNVTTNVTWTLPAQDGTANQVLITNGSGQLNWYTLPSVDGGGNILTPPGGSNSQVQFNSNGSFAGDSEFTYDANTNTLTVGSVLGDLTGDVTGNVTGDVTGNVTGDVTGNVTGDVTGNVTGDIESTGVSTFAEATIAKGSVDNAPIGATTRNTGAFTTLTSNGQTTFTNTADSSTPTTGAVRVSGGLGVALNANVGGNMTVNNTITSNGNIVSNSNVVINNRPTQPNHATNKSYVDSRSLALSIALGG